MAVAKQTVGRRGDEGSGACLQDVAFLALCETASANPLMKDGSLQWDGDFCISRCPFLP